MGYNIEIEKRAYKELSLIKQANLQKKFEYIIQILKTNPFQNPPKYEKLVGNLAGKYSRRLNIQHRIVYSVDEEVKTVRIYSVWSHYE